MTEIIGVRFKPCGKEYYFAPNGGKYRVGDLVIVDTAKGLDLGKCTKANTMLEDEQVVQPLCPVLRAATDQDVTTLRRNRQREKEAFAICEEKIAEHKLDMTLVRCECSFDGSKLLFYFISEGRVDFRALVRSLAAALHTRIELRQIGVRDETRLLGGLGICGRPFCCNGFLEQFHPVSIKMAKIQGLPLNPAKISGACGRLMCCLQYEQNAYEDALRRLPRNGSFVETPDGPGSVTDVNLLRETVQVRPEADPDTLRTYAGEEINVIRSGRGKRPEDYVAPPPSELERLRTVTPPPAAPEKPGLTDSAVATSDRPDFDCPKGRNRRTPDGGPRQNDRPYDKPSGRPNGKPNDRFHSRRANERPKQEEGRPPRPESDSVRQEPRTQERSPRDAGEDKSQVRGHSYRRYRRGGRGQDQGGAE